MARFEVLPHNFSRGTEKKHEMSLDSVCFGRDSRLHFFFLNFGQKHYHLLIRYLHNGTADCIAECNQMF